MSETPERTITIKQATTEIHFHCDRCGLDKTHTRPGSSGGTGYGRRDDGSIACYACCGESDLEYMREHGKIALYLTGKSLPSASGSVGFIPEKIVNWPGSISFDVLSWSLGGHNWGIPRYDVWFKGPDGRVWYGVHMGNWTQIVHCKRTKHTGYAGIVARSYGLQLANTGE